MMICDECMAKRVREGTVKPHIFVMPFTSIRWQKRQCGACQKDKSCVRRDDLDTSFIDEILGFFNGRKPNA